MELWEFVLFWFVQVLFPNDLLELIMAAAQQVKQLIARQPLFDPELRVFGK